jgi:hypothetical protein
MLEKPSVREKRAAAGRSVRNDSRKLLTNLYFRLPAAELIIYWSGGMILAEKAYFWLSTSDA